MPWLTILRLLRRFWPFIAGAVLVLAILVAAQRALHRYGVRQYKAGEAAVMVRWDADEAEETRLADAQAKQNAIDEAAAAARNQVIADEHAKELAAARAERDRNTGLLAAYRRAARASAAAQDSHQPGTAPAGTDGSAGPVDAEAELDGLIADVIAEHRANASQLNSLIGELVPQLDPPQPAEHAPAGVAN